MDSKDFQILVAIHQDARQSLLSLGRRVSLSAPAVRERLQRLHRNGVLPGYGLWIDPTVFGRQEVLIFYRRERTCDQVMRALKAPNVAYIGWKIGGGLTVGAWTEDVSRSISEINIALGERSSGHAVTGAGDIPAFSVLDFMIADALIEDPKIPFEKLADSTRLSPKTVRKHLESMIRSEALVIVPRLGEGSGSGELVYNLAIAGKVPMSEIRKIMEDAVMVHETRNPPMKYLLCRSTDLGDINSKTKAVSRLEGIQSVAVTLNRELLFANDFIHSLVRKRIRELEAKRTSQAALRLTEVLAGENPRLVKARI